MRATTGPGAGPIRQALPMSMRRTARRNDRSLISLASPAFCRSMAMPATEPGRARRGQARLLLEPCAPALLRACRRRPGADRQRGARTHRQLYAVESEIRGRSAEERRDVRQDKSRPILKSLEPWLTAKLALISQKTKLAEAIRYALSRWQGLSLFLDDGRIEIDSNVVERAIRPIALNRKNALFAGSDGGGEHWAIIASLIETCKLGGIDPHDYLADVITKIVNGHPNSHIDDLLPWTYAPYPRSRPWPENTAYAYAVFHATHTGEGRPGAANRQEGGDGLCLRDAVRRRQDKAYAEDLARRARHEGAWLGVEIDPLFETTGGGLLPGQHASAILTGVVGRCSMPRWTIGAPRIGVLD